MIARGSPTVLTVDDDKGLVDLYATWLEPEYSVRMATDGDIGLQKLCSEIDVVILDRDMPTVSGDEFLRQCRHGGWDCRVLMVTGAEPESDILDLDFDDYLVKPVERQMLLNRVSMLLQRKCYCDDVKEYLALSSKIAIINQHLTVLGNREKIERLIERRAELRNRIVCLLDDTSQRNFDAEFHRLTAHAD